MILDSFIELAHSKLEDPVLASKVCVAWAAADLVVCDPSDEFGLVTAVKMLKNAHKVLSGSSKKEIFEIFITMAALAEMISDIRDGDTPGELPFYETAIRNSPRFILLEENFLGK